MQEKLLWVALVLAATILVGCSKETAPVVPQVQVPRTGSPQSAVTPPAAQGSLHDQAMALLREGKPLEAAQRLKELTAKEPTADNWNDLSYAYLLNEQYREAKAAADEALKLNAKHPGALYNAGMAALYGESSDALHLLLSSAELQPDRFEPKLGLAMAYAKGRNVAMAFFYLHEAERLAPGNAEVAAQRQSIEALFVADVEQLPSTCKAQLKEPDYSLCLAPSSPAQSASAAYDLILMPAKAGQKGYRVSIGSMYSADTVMERVTLPGGVTGVWFRQLDAVVDMYQWHLVAVRDEKLFPVVFTGDRGGSSVVRAFSQPPAIAGDLVRASAFNASRNGLIHSAWKLSADLATAALVSREAGGFK